MNFIRFVKRKPLEIKGSGAIRSTGEDNLRHVGATFKRRMVTVPAVMVAAVLFTVFIPVWVPLSLVVDVMRRRIRVPTTRLLLFATCWAWLETVGVLVAAMLWLIGRSSSHEAHYALQRWWASRLIASLRFACGVRISISGLDALPRGPIIALCRHASLADSLVSAWLFGSKAALRPRYVLKRELSFDPCLDIVGRRIPNYFVDRSASDTKAELEGIRAMAEGMSDGDVAVIFPEGTRANPVKRERLLTKIEKRDSARGSQLRKLRHLLPPKVAGASALFDALPDANVVVVWHVGFEGMDTFGGIIEQLSQRSVRAYIAVEPHMRQDVPDTQVGPWLDAVWLDVDAKVHNFLGRN